MELNIIHNEDCRTGLQRYPDSFFNCCVTSPPYWGLRDYGVDGQLGLEGTPEEYVAGMVGVFREVKRVLRDDGTLWVNIGDSYAHNGAAYHSEKSTLIGRKQGEEMGKAKRFVKSGTGLKPKDLVGIPWMLAFALRADGWYLRDCIIWHKPNPMPESVTDRTTKSHEYVFLFAKSGKKTIWTARDTGEWSNTPDLSQFIDTNDGERTPRWRGFHYYYNAAAIREPPAASTLQRWSQDIDKQEGSARVPGKTNGAMKAVGGPRKDKQRGHSRRHAGFNERWDLMTTAEQQAYGANKRSVWTISTKPFHEAHFATFPEELPRICILAGCPEGGAVLDPFMGAGTTGMVARKLQRSYVGFELNPEYVAIAERRLRKNLGMFL
ncbi:DNA-methyltransferase [Chitinophaga japonensis]|uniref:Methyltransferase n=1 Tax=Chitinophaga japonensis TaxID=104662 RepID=A0A562SYD3_CHIJA|nr:site-specific DNA-methyltransferase [Chitinophaga japonensis]TWI86321.1 DNA methylase [Chitinophaga japonensis]